jgi:hypothetical protein
VASWNQVQPADLIVKIKSLGLGYPDRHRIINNQQENTLIENNNNSNQEVQLMLDRLGITQEQYDSLLKIDAPAVQVMQELPDVDPRIVIPTNPKIHINSLKNLVPYQTEERQREIRQRVGQSSTLKPLVSSRKRTQQELVNLLRKFKPHLTASVQTAVKTLHGEAPESVKLQAAKLILSEYRGLLKDLDAVSDEGDEVEMVQSPRFSLTVVEDATVNEKPKGE